MHQASQTHTPNCSQDETFEHTHLAREREDLINLDAERTSDRPTAAFLAVMRPSELFSIEPRIYDTLCLQLKRLLSCC